MAIRDERCREDIFYFTAHTSNVNCGRRRKKEKERKKKEKSLKMVSQRKNDKKENM